MAGEKHTRPNNWKFINSAKHPFSQNKEKRNTNE
jgi:hypothetical protein